MEICFRSIYKVFLSMPVDLGGLGLSTLVIEKLLSILGILVGIFQFCFFARINSRWGPKKVFIAGLAFSFPLFLLFPVISILARCQEYSFTVWAAVGLQMVFFILSKICHLVCASLFVIGSSVDRRPFFRCYPYLNYRLCALPRFPWCDYWL